MRLRGYQQQAIDDLRNAYRAGAKAPLLCLPTGGGKTIIFSAIAQSAVGRGRQVLILVHRRELLHQASRKLTDIGLNHGLIAAGIPTSRQPVQVASVQTLVRRLSRLDWQPSLIIIDEAHHASAGSWAAILDKWPEAFRLGVTATPCRLDGRGLGTAFDQLVLGPSVADLISAGFLSPARIYAPPVVADFTGLRRRAGDYAADQAATAMDRPTVTGDAIAHYQRLAPGQRAIAFCCSIDHANHVAASFNAAGIPAATLLGNTTDRDAVVAAFDAGSVQILVTVDVVSEGFDIPAASCAILLRPTQSLGLYLQQVGRVLRPAPGKDHALVLDHVGNVHRHGFPDDHREWTLEEGARRATSTAAPSVRTCPECFAAFKPAPVCPCCGHEQPIAKPRIMRQVEGELQEMHRDFEIGDNVKVWFGEDEGWMPLFKITKTYDAIHRHKGVYPHADLLCLQTGLVSEGDTLIQIAFDRIKLVSKSRREQGRARTLPQLLALAKERGYSPGWAYRIAAARGKR
jgi:DNA repair protein RadD